MGFAGISLDMQSVFRGNLECIIDVLPYLLAIFSEGGALALLFGMPSYPLDQKLKLNPDKPILQFNSLVFMCKGLYLITWRHARLSQCSSQRGVDMRMIKFSYHPVPALVH